MFDTSGLNKIADDEELKVITAALISSFSIRLTTTHVAEIVANQDVHRRRCLFDCIRPLVALGEGLYPFHVILETLIKRFEQNPLSFDWSQVAVRFRALEDG